MIFNQKTLLEIYNSENGTQTRTAVDPLIEAGVEIAVRRLTSLSPSPSIPRCNGKLIEYLSAH